MNNVWRGWMRWHERGVFPWVMCPQSYVIWVYWNADIWEFHLLDGYNASEGRRCRLWVISTIMVPPSLLGAGKRKTSETQYQSILRLLWSDRWSDSLALERLPVHSSPSPEPYLTCELHSGIPCQVYSTRPCKEGATEYVANAICMKLTVLLSLDTIFLFISASKHLFALAWLSSGPLTN